MSLPLALVLLASIGCSKKATPKNEADKHDHGQEAGEARGSHVPLEGIRGLRLMKVAEPRLEGRWVPGEAIGDEAAQALLSSPVKGIVSQILTAPGLTRGEGATLALIQSPELARLKAQWIAARAKLSRTQADLAREERLFQAGAGARRDLESVRSEADTAKAEEEAARLGLEAVGLKPGDAGATFTLKAPASGSVVAWKVQRGQGVEAGQEMGTFQAAQAAVVRLELSQPGPIGWTSGTVSEVRQANGRTWKARLEGTPATLTTDTRRLSYRLRFVGGQLPIPGTSVEVKVPMEKGVFLPQAALQQVEGRWGVFVVEKEQAEFRPVKRGTEIKDEVLVLEGLKPGETVVAEGAYLLKAYQQKRTQPEGEEGGHGH
ncbi:MAG: efflux RND transporter periplasmic adaptor subunit [Geothrix sp.]|uniref:Efflux RND transporter periplasmic adaptor subunit n=1 Tax=Candidatus Geothrix odensensis TaxID=2954440 RepID=A0A936K5N1_9BACT|nr:efflux RND transporter periplasmic adaptor subunit [Candidatus Geothrix odensensis]MCC6513991.1 efflux RND transporter periplasmic adaptor subunit [Geothrix sp.]